MNEPDDIRAAARRAFEEARVMSIFDTQVSIIARAIMSERERCAMIVEDSVFKIGGIYAQNIAAAIRSPAKEGPK